MYKRQDDDGGGDDNDDDNVVVVYLFQQSKQNVQLQHNKFNKARQSERQMPIMLATYRHSTNTIIVSETMCYKGKKN